MFQQNRTKNKRSNAIFVTTFNDIIVKEVLLTNYFWDNLLFYKKRIEKSTFQKLVLFVFFFLAIIVFQQIGTKLIDKMHISLLQLKDMVKIKGIFLYFYTIYSIVQIGFSNLRVWKGSCELS
eukprot:TRINITY_DN89645_c0_g1_i2.p4 TRINITY_DN89645_c0_g1~~TRINITY_DN89645_c0_g1_i2.p4  ORF type:complete len:122 (-),score=0.41 TRINITY_DN89645_c0_g1_i2:336-701(-)